MRRSLESRKKSLKTRFLDFKVVQGHQCRFLRKARPLFHDKLVIVAQIALFEKMPRFEVPFGELLESKRLTF